jgi:hypothetical protein
MAGAKRERTVIAIILLMMAMTFLWIIAPDRICDVDPSASGVNGIIQSLERPIKHVVAGGRTEAQCVGRMTIALGLLLFGGGAGISALILWRGRRGTNTMDALSSEEVAPGQWHAVVPESVNAPPDSGTNRQS